MKTLLAGLIAASALFSPLSSAFAQDPDVKTLSLSFGVYQTEKATVMYKKLSPVLEPLQSDLEARLGRPVDIQLKIFKSYEDGIDALAKGEIDFVRFGPASYITAKERQSNIQLLAMELENGEKRFQGVIVVPKASTAQTLADLKGKRFAFGDPNSTIGRYLAQAELVKAGLHSTDFSTWKYLGRHDTVVSAVLMGDYDAGSVAWGNYKTEADKGTLRALCTFENVTKPWVARAGLDEKTFTGLQQSLLAFKDAAALKELKISGFSETSDKEYQFVREGKLRADEFDRKTTGNLTRQSGGN